MISFLEAYPEEEKKYTKILNIKHDAGVHLKKMKYFEI